jgi:hypothetical protein
MVNIKTSNKKLEFRCTNPLAIKIVLQSKRFTFKFMLLIYAFDLAMQAVDLWQKDFSA